jgi:NAD(P)-dependent dehydrogenase (short-subunit alcohol dehydrogenase family)
MAAPAAAAPPPPAQVLFCVGGAGGIGSACSRLFHARGWRVVVLDLAASSGAALAAELDGARAGSALFHAIDVSTEASVAAAFAAGLAFSGGACSALVVMSASFQYGEVHEVTEAQWEAVCATNLKGPALCLKQVIPAMRAAGRGAIVLTSSITARLAFPAFVPYSATKAALEQMARDVSLDNGRFGVRCNCVAPGPIFTQGGTVAHAGRMGQPVEELCAELAADVALRRMGRVEEVAKACYFLACEESSYVTGAVLHVDGGFCRK